MLHRPVRQPGNQTVVVLWLPDLLLKLLLLLLPLLLRWWLLLHGHLLPWLLHPLLLQLRRGSPRGQVSHRWGTATCAALAVPARLRYPLPVAVASEACIHPCKVFLVPLQLLLLQLLVKQPLLLLFLLLLQLLFLKLVLSQELLLGLLVDWRPPMQLLTSPSQEYRID